METRKVYASYGVLAHEKRPLFTVDAPAGEINDSWDIALPDGWEWVSNEAGETLVRRPDGQTYLGNEIISNWGDRLCLRWTDERGDHKIILG